jgi:hypothetical protein
MSALDDLLHYLFEGSKPSFYPEFEAWVRESRRYRAFVTTYRSKIRAKLTHVSGDNGLSDLRAELETAMLLLREEHFTLDYEHYAALKQRGPDFTVTFKTHTPFNVEVRRIRKVEADEDEAEARIGKLIAVLCDKIKQMPPSIVNILWLIADRDVTDADLAGATLMLRQLAERKTEEFFTRRGFESASAFFKQYRHLSGIVLRQTGSMVIWLNPLARHLVPPKIAAALRRLDQG